MSTEQAINALRARYQFAIAQAVRAPGSGDRRGTREFWTHRARIALRAIDRLRFPYVTRPAA